MHGDDRVEQGFYEEIKALFTSHTEAGAVYTNYSYINGKSEKLYPIRPELKEAGIIKNFLLKIASNQTIQPPSIVVKRVVYETLGGFYGVHYAEDW